MGRAARNLANIFKLLKKNIDENPEYKREIYNKETGEIYNAKLFFTTEDREENVAIIFQDGNIEVIEDKVDSPSITLIFKDAKELGKLSRSSSQEIVDNLLYNKMQYLGSLSHITRFFFLLSYIFLDNKKSYQERQKLAKKKLISFEEFNTWKNGTAHYRYKRLGYKIDNVKFLEDPYLSMYVLDDFKRLNYLKYRHFNTRVEICPERARLITDWAKQYGYLREDGNNEHPELKQGKILNYILSNKKPIIAEWDLLAGTTTTKEKGVILYPEFGAIGIWPELYTVDNRPLQPHNITQETIDLLNYEVFPYWAERCIREYTRQVTGNPISQQLEEFFVLYFMWKTQTISHTIPGFPFILNEGLENIKQKIINKRYSSKEQNQKDFYNGLELALEGVLNYAKNLSLEADRLAKELNKATPSELVETRKEELLNLAKICAKVPAKPSETLEEAVNAIWITWVALHHENSNNGLSIGRLDYWLQPFFEADMKKAQTEDEKEQIIKKTIELIGCFFLRTVDHEPIVPDIGNFLFGGSGSDQAITLGGVDKEGKNAVCDMTYIILKVAEMLCLRDPNLNARYHPIINSKEYLDRLCEVNINTCATPSIHNDIKMIKALTNQNFALEDARNWAATGCVEPTICGMHFGHTNCMLLNTVAAMEMALNNGYHPVISTRNRIGPITGDLNQIKSYQDFLKIYQIQLHFLIDNSVEYNNALGKIHQLLHPYPLISTLIEGPIEKGKDVVDGGAKYNTSGVALVGLTDVIDSLKVIKSLIYDKQYMDLVTLNKHLEQNFSTPEGEQLHKVISKVPKFGSGDEETIQIAQDLVDYMYHDYLSHTNYRGGKYLVGFWSMSNHVAFGTLSGALPSGRKANMPFTPGLTPAPSNKDQLIQNIQSVAALDTLKMPNNLAFNIKLVPSGNDNHEETLNYFNGYAKSYFDLGGMQMQFNVIKSDILRDAMIHPENYGWLIVRISGYNAYFTSLNKEMQLELINRTEFLTH